MTAERVLAWLSFLILLSFAGAYLLAMTTIGWLNEGIDKYSLLAAMAVGLPGVVFLVASYRQLYRPRPYLILTAIILGILVVMLGAYEFIQDNYTIGINTKELTCDFTIALALLLIPIYSNFKRHFDTKKIG